MDERRSRQVGRLMGSLVLAITVLGVATGTLLLVISVACGFAKDSVVHRFVCVEPRWAAVVAVLGVAALLLLVGAVARRRA